MQGDTVQLFSDGACKGNPGPGGWGAVLVTPAGKKTLFGGEPDTTNNRMELTAVIEGLRALPTASRVVITTDSQYVKNGMEQWIHGWKRNGWRTADKKPVKNADLWQALDAAIAGHQVSWRWVRGHTGHPENELADRLANRGVDQALRGGGARDPEVEAEADPAGTPAVFRADLRVHALAVSRDGVGTRLVLEATALPPGPAVRLRLDFGGAEALRLARPLELPWDLPGLEVVELAPADAGRPRYRVQSREVGGLSLTCRGFSRGDPDPPGR